MNQKFKLTQKQWIIIGVVTLIAVVGIYLLIGNKVTNDGNKKETGLNAQFSDNQNTLGNCLVKIKQSANIVGANVDAVDRILSDAVKGRYSEGSSAQIGQGALFSAIQEAYPDITQLGFNKLMDTANGCRDDYATKQTKLLDMLRDFDSWRTGSWTVRHFGGGYPNDNLEARVGGKLIATGKPAEDKMKEIVLPSNAIDAYTNGVMPDDLPFEVTTSK